MKVLIISGAGILAGTHLYNQLVKGIVELKKFNQDCDFPEIVLYNYPFESIESNGNLKEDLAKKELEKIINKFSDFDHIIIACNTFHTLSLSSTNILSLPGTALDKLNKINNKKSLVLCSAYSKEKELFASKDVVYTNEEISIYIEEIISKNIYSYNKYEKEDFKKLNEFIKNQNISHLVIGCTELSIIDWKNIVDIPVIDAVELVVNDLLNKLKRG